MRSRLTILVVMGIALGLAGREAEAVKVRVNGRGVVVRSGKRSAKRHYVNMAHRYFHKLRKAQVTAAQKAYAQQREAERLAAEKSLRKRQAAADAARAAKERERERFKARQANAASK